MANLVEAGKNYLGSVTDRTVGFYAFREVYRYITTAGSENPNLTLAEKSKSFDSLVGFLAPATSNTFIRALRHIDNRTDTPASQILLALASVPALLTDSVLNS